MRNHYFSVSLSNTVPTPIDALPELEDVLAGPDRDAEAVVIDDAMAKKFPDLLKDIAQLYAISFATDGRLRQSIGCPFREFINALPQVDRPILIDDENDDLRIIRLPENDDGTQVYGALVKNASEEWTLRGMIVDADICVDPIYRGLGIGSALVAAQLVDQGHLAVWNHDRPGYSHAGAGCVERGVSLAQRLIAPHLAADRDMSENFSI